MENRDLLRRRLSKTFLAHVRNAQLKRKLAAQNGLKKFFLWGLITCFSTVFVGYYLAEYDAGFTGLGAKALYAKVLKKKAKKHTKYHAKKTNKSKLAKKKKTAKGKKAAFQKKAKNGKKKLAMKKHKSHKPKLVKARTKPAKKKVTQEKLSA